MAKDYFELEQPAAHMKRRALRGPSKQVYFCARYFSHLIRFIFAIIQQGTIFACGKLLRFWFVSLQTGDFNFDL
jgi:hypothetical protein